MRRDDGNSFTSPLSHSGESKKDEDEAFDEHSVRAKAIRDCSTSMVPYTW